KDKSSLLSKNLLNLLNDLNVIQKKISIGAFASIANEPLWDLELPAEYLKLTAYPAFNAGDENMTFKLSQRNELIVKKDFGLEIRGPKENAPDVSPGVILVPGLAFTKKGERLGRGKGFYDKYLSSYRGIKIGLCFSAQLSDLLPTEEHDVKLDYIVTEEEIINCMHA
ncbi:MAG: 5-formyltetrahydrofolate cyclo-ligase, partial [Bacteriovorax sp.]